MESRIIILIISILSLLSIIVYGESGYQVGVGIWDMTGPSVEINFMGYAVPGQRGTGIHLRLRARTFIFVSSSDPNQRFAFVSVDGGMGSDLVKMRVVDKLQEELKSTIYTTENIAISGTHTHSGPAGFLQYVLYQVTSLGWVKETFDAWVDGITASIVMAHKNIAAGKVLLTQGTLTGANINRSPTSYLLNPEDERSSYLDGDTDKNMLMLEIVNDDKSKSIKRIGALTFFAVHGTSMNNTNTLTSGDNRGYASYALEKEINGADSEVGLGPFVAAFASSNLGDVSPNTMGAKCIDTGLPCNGTASSCRGRCEKCIAFGPGENGDMFQSTQIIGDKQFQHALNLMKQAEQNTADTAVVGSIVDFRHSFVDMSTLSVTLEDGRSVTLCAPAMGYSFAAGTTDGPGMFGFLQGTTTDNPFWNKVRDFLSEPTQEEIDCQAPKPILLNTGDIGVPYDWDPRTVPLQILRLNNVFILCVPSEFTTMAGRRLRKAVKAILDPMVQKEGFKEAVVTISGLCNTYSSYVTTYEEYQAQRYEAASTIFGPHTLSGYIQEFTRLAKDFVTGTKPSTTGPAPPDLTDVQIQLMPEARFDMLPYNSTVKFRDIVEGKDVLPSYRLGQNQIAQATFYGANPRNNFKTQSTYMTVEKKGSVKYDVVARDGDWSTKFMWQAGFDDPLQLGIRKQSTATLWWNISSEVSAGTYRLCYHGDHKVAKVGVAVPFNGCSSNFQVVV